MFQIRYGLGGGFGGCGEWEDCDVGLYAEAEKIAYEMACQDYESYEGLHGILDAEQMLEEDPSLSEADIEEELNQQRESWVEFEVRIKPENFGDEQHVKNY